MQKYTGTRKKILNSLSELNEKKTSDKRISTKKNDLLGVN